MSDSGHVWLKVALLYGMPILLGGVSVTAFMVLWRDWQGVAVYLLNTGLSAIGAAVAGFIGRDNPSSRLRGMLDCGAFGIVVHFFAAAFIAFLVVQFDVRW